LSNSLPRLLAIIGEHIPSVKTISLTFVNKLSRPERGQREDEGW
jgi:hypothetical protein